jgi:hypothetical protein
MNRLVLRGGLLCRGLGTRGIGPGASRICSCTCRRMRIRHRRLRHMRLRHRRLRRGRRRGRRAGCRSWRGSSRGLRQRRRRDRELQEQNPHGRERRPRNRRQSRQCDARWGKQAGHSSTVCRIGRKRTPRGITCVTTAPARNCLRPARPSLGPARVVSRLSRLAPCRQVRYTLLLPERLLQSGDIRHERAELARPMRFPAASHHAANLPATFAASFWNQLPCRPSNQ